MGANRPKANANSGRKRSVSSRTIGPRKRSIIGHLLYGKILPKRKFALMG